VHTTNTHLLGRLEIQDVYKLSRVEILFLEIQCGLMHFFKFYMRV
jgi:hypothetical protein